MAGFLWRLGALLLCVIRTAAANTECGHKGVDNTLWARVVNGQQASKCEWRWQACLKTPGQRGCWCGGTLISETWVLTAAHCVADGGAINVMLGDFNHVHSGDANEQEIPAKEVIPHDQYDADTMQYDFALIELSSPAQLNDCVGTACLPDVSQAVSGGETCFISGWGTLSSGGNQPNKIQEGEVQILSNVNCGTNYGAGVITSDMVCAQGQDSDGDIVDGCQGDSGGPLVCKDSDDDKWYVQGATSWGYGCASRHYPGVWARVTHELAWIQGHIDSGGNPGPAPTPAPTAAIDFDGHMFKVTSGPCELSGHCVQSPNFPGQYGKDELCVIAVNVDKAERVTVTSFNTEVGYDILNVNGNEYSGVLGPGGVRPTTAIVWTSDHLIESGGWQLCPHSFVDGETAAPTPAPTSAPPAPATPAPPPTAELQCGQRGVDESVWPEGRIVHGQDSTACEWPWQVGLRSSFGSETFCGGTLISERWVLTAAHCIGDGIFAILLGDHDLSSSSDTDSVVVQTSRVIPHPEYDEATFDFDFALVELSEDAPIGDCINMACLPDADVADGAECWITGWGTLSSGGAAPNKMQEGKVTVLSDSDCRAKYSADEITENMLCAQGQKNGNVVDGCQGDSGGPLVCEKDGTGFVIHGATSWGYGCADEQYPGVWARVFKVKDWIDGFLNAAETPAPTAAEVEDGKTWQVLSGSCTISVSNCLQSPNYPQTYGNEERCVIQVAHGNAMAIEVVAFAVEKWFDSLMINGAAYSDTDGPVGVVPTAGMVWSSDHSETADGWELCLAAPTPAPTLPAECEDVIINGEAWHDSDGADYNCAWYAEGTNCADHGMAYQWPAAPLQGHVADEACCACGGGVIATPAPPTPAPCENTDGVATDSEEYTCEFGYSLPGWDAFCDNYDDEDFTSSIHCCACGGGDTGAGDVNLGGGLRETTTMAIVGDEPATKVKIAGSVTFEAAGVTQDQAEKAVKGALGQQLGVRESHVTVEASPHSGRRLSASTGWSVAYDIVVIEESSEDIFAAAAALADQAANITSDANSTSDGLADFTQTLLAELARSTGKSEAELQVAFKMVGFAPVDREVVVTTSPAGDFSTHTATDDNRSNAIIDSAYAAPCRAALLLSVVASAL